MKRWKRNIIVWTLCAIFIILVVLFFIYLRIVPPWMR